MPLSPEGGGAAAAGVMDAVQLRKERRWARSLARFTIVSSPLEFDELTPKPERERERERERSGLWIGSTFFMKTTVLFLTDHAVDAYLEMFMGELSLRADEFFLSHSQLD